MTPPHPTSGDLPAAAGEARFTPGPWHVETNLLVGTHLAVLAGDYGIAKVWNEESGMRSEHEANAHLIAAAPDLFEACLAVLNSGMRNAAYDACVAALNKARGK